VNDFLLLGALVVVILVTWVLVLFNRRQP